MGASPIHAQERDILDRTLAKLPRSVTTVWPACTTSMTLHMPHPLFRKLEEETLLRKAERDEARVHVAALERSARCDATDLNVWSIIHYLGYVERNYSSCTLLPIF